MTGCSVVLKQKALNTPLCTSIKPVLEAVNCGSLDKGFRQFETTRWLKKFLLKMKDVCLQAIKREVWLWKKWTVQSASYWKDIGLW